MCVRHHVVTRGGDRLVNKEQSRQRHAEDPSVSSGLVGRLGAGPLREVGQGDAITGPATPDSTTDKGILRWSTGKYLNLPALIGHVYVTITESLRRRHL